MVKRMGLTRGDDLRPTRDDYSITSTYRCLDEIVTNKLDKSNEWNQVHRPIIQDRGRSSEDFIEPTQNRLIILVIQDQGWISEDFIEPTQNHLREIGFKVIKSLKTLD